jgi:hypothetical protein
MAQLAGPDTAGPRQRGQVGAAAAVHGQGVSEQLL